MNRRGYLISFGLLIAACFFSGSLLAIDMKDVTDPSVDKAAHFGAAATAQTVCYTIGKAITGSKWGSTISCFVAINAAGALKEYVDPYRSGHQREMKDIYANLAGTGFSAALITIGF